MYVGEKEIFVANGISRKKLKTGDIAETLTGRNLSGFLVPSYRYCLTNLYFQSIITISILYFYFFTAYSRIYLFNRVCGLRNFQRKIKYKREEDVMADFLKRNRAEGAPVRRLKYRGVKVPSR